MRDQQVRPLGLDVDFSEPLLSPDLEWMLRSNQASVAMIVETILQEHYPDLYRFAFSIYNDPQQARECIAETLVLAADKTHHELGEVSVRTWLYSLLVSQAIKRHKDFRSSMIDSDNHKNPGSAIYAGDPDVFECLDSMNLPDRLTITLHYQHELTIPEIAYVFKSNERDIQLQISRLKSDISACLEVISTPQYASRAWIQAVMNKQFPANELDGGTRELLVAKCVATVNSQRARRRRFTTVMQFLLAGAVVIFIAALSWLTNRLAGHAGGRPVVITVIVTKVIYVEPTVEGESFENRTPSPEPLGESASFSDVITHMRDNSRLWSTIWLDGRIMEYGPPGYTGPPLTRREQVWLEQPNRSLVLSGWAGGAVDRVYYFSNRLESDLNLRQNSPFTRFIFPYQFEFRSEEYRVIAGDQISGRKSLILEGYREDASLAERIWVDAEIGVILRQQRFASDGASLLSEIVVREIVYDATFPKYILDTYQPIQHFSQDFSGQPSLISDEYPTPKRTPAPGHRPLPRASPPADYDPSSSPIYFQWNQAPVSEDALLGIQDRTGEEEYGRDIPVDVFAGGYYLGQVQFNPWEARCIRSADGNLVALISLTGDRDAPEYHLHWFFLGDIYNQAELALDISSLGRALAIAPDGRRLAFYACVGNPGAVQCGVYLADLQDGSYSIFHPTNQVYDLAWSSDSKTLEMWSYLSDRESQKIAFEIETGELIYAGPVYRDNSKYYYFYGIPRRSDGYILGSIGRNGCSP